MFNRLTQYLKDSKVELKKVVWPSKKQTTNHTLLVIGFSLAVAIFLGTADFVLNKLLALLVY
jgi:preprotein translocase subunit SecE